MPSGSLYHKYGTLNSPYLPLKPPRHFQESAWGPLLQHVPSKQIHTGCSATSPNLRCLVISSLEPFGQCFMKKLCTRSASWPLFPFCGLRFSVNLFNNRTKTGACFRLRALRSKTQDLRSVTRPLNYLNYTEPCTKERLPYSGTMRPFHH